MTSEVKFNVDKNSLRLFAKRQRATLSNKAQMDAAICTKLMSLAEYKNCKTVFCYMSLNDEVGTDGLIQSAFDDGKMVAVPFCRDNKGNMDFYYINSFDDLVVQSFGVREPVTTKCNIVTDFEDSIIILPGLCFDKDGNRLGYGKGYYDRFLQKHSLISIGLCYNSLIVKNVPTDRYDKKVDYIITENDVYITNGGKNG